MARDSSGQGLLGFQVDCSEGWEDDTHAYNWRCQKILGSWGPKCQAHLNGGWVENTNILTCSREVLIVMKISPTVECRLQGTNLQMNIWTVLQTFRLSDINHTMQNLSLYFAENCIPVTDHFQMWEMLLIFWKWYKLRLCDIYYRKVKCCNNLMLDKKGSRANILGRREKGWVCGITSQANTLCV